MTPLSQTPAAALRPSAISSAAPRASRLLSGIYHDIGMAAVALGLDLSFETLEPATNESVKRGARYICLMPKREPSAA